MFDTFEEEYLLNYGGWADTPRASYGGTSSMDVITSLAGSALAVYQGASASGPSLKEQLTTLANSTEAQLKANLYAVSNGQLAREDGQQNAWNLLNGMVAQMLRGGTQGQLSAAERDRRIDPGYLRWDWIAWYIEPMMTSGETIPALPASVQTGASGGLVNQAGYGSTYTRSDNQMLYIAGAALLAVLLLRRK